MRDSDLLREIERAPPDVLRAALAAIEAVQPTHIPTCALCGKQTHSRVTLHQRSPARPWRKRPSHIELSAGVWWLCPACEKDRKEDTR